MGFFSINTHSLGKALILLDCIAILTLFSAIDYIEVFEHSVDGKTAIVRGCFIVALAISCFSMGLYQNCYKMPDRLLEKLTVVFVMIVVMTTACSVAGPAFKADVGMTLFATFFGCGAILVTRLIAARIAARTQLQRRIVFLGDPTIVDQLRQLPDVARTTRFTVLPVGGRGSAPIVRTDAERLTRIRRAARAHELVLADDYEATAVTAAALLHCRLEGVRVTLMSAFMERETRKLALTDDEARRLVLACSPRRTLPSRLAKRGIDVLGSLVLLALTLPLLLLVGLAIKLTDGGPVFYRQARIGLGGRPFMITKFRTMRVDAEAAGARWAMQRDDRITPIGRLLRRPRIDELPQLFDVLRGRMSLVGPRPEQVPMCEKLAATIPLYAYRHLVLPGLTGWAQVNLPYADSLESTVDKTQYDLYYLKNGSVILDLIILIQTIRIVLFSEGSR